MHANLSSKSIRHKSSLSFMPCLPSSFLHFLLSFLRSFALPFLSKKLYLLQQKLFFVKIHLMLFYSHFTFYCPINHYQISVLHKINLKVSDLSYFCVKEYIRRFHVRKYGWFRYSVNKGVIGTVPNNRNRVITVRITVLFMFGFKWR